MTPQQATFTVILGSIGRPTIANLLDSIERQARMPGDQCIVALDSYEFGERQDVQDLVHSYGEGYIACAYNSGYHWLGVEQINYAMRTIPITGTHILTIGDDDVFVDDAYRTIRRHCTQDLLRPVMYRVLSPPSVTDPAYRELLPVQKGIWPFIQGRIGGSSIAAPWPLVQPMTTERTIHHDYMWVSDIVRSAEKEPLWLDYCAMIARPPKRSDDADVMHRGVWHCRYCERWEYVEDLIPLSAYCKCGGPFDLFGHLARVA